MLTDDAFTRHLRRAFHDCTEDLAYDRPLPSPPRLSPAAASRMAAGALGVGAAAVVASGAFSHSAAPGHTTAAGARTPAATAAPTTTVTRTFTLAGYTLRYQQPAGDQPLAGTWVSAVPASATKVTVSELDGQQTTDYVGVDAATGYPTAYIATASGRVLAITSPDATVDRLTAMLTAPTPSPIPVVGGSGG